MMNEFNNIKKSPNQVVTDFKIKFQKVMHKLFQILRLDDNVFLTIYVNAFNSKMAYLLRDKDPQNLRDSFIMAINIESNRRDFGKLGRREDHRFSKSAKDKVEKPLGSKPKRKDKWDKVLSTLKDLKLTVARSDKCVESEKQYFNKFRRPQRLQDYPYNTNLKDGKPVQQQQKSKKEQQTPNRLQKHTVNVVEDTRQCIVCQSPNSHDYCALAQFIAVKEELQEEQEEETFEDDNIYCLMTTSYLKGIKYFSDIETWDLDVDHQRQKNESYYQQVFSDDELSVDDQVCNVEHGEDVVSLRRPFDEEIARISATVVAQVKSKYQLRNIIIGEYQGKSSSLFIKHINNKGNEVK